MITLKTSTTNVSPSLHKTACNVIYIVVCMDVGGKENRNNKLKTNLNSKVRYKNRYANSFCMM